MERNYWEENGHVKYDNYNSNDGFGRGGEQLNFAAAPSDDEGEYPPAGGYLKKGKVSRQDPMSHRIIEKRRRDRMNNCLADLSRLIPPEYLKKGRGRVEKTEIIEMAIRHLKFLQERANGLYRGTECTPDYAAERQVGEFRAGYQEAAAEAVRYLADVHGYRPADGLCVQLAAHLQRHCDHVTKVPYPGDVVREKPHPQGGSSSETSSSGSSRGYVVKPGVIATAPPPPAAYSSERYDPPEDKAYPMDCDRVSVTELSVGAAPAAEPLALRAVRRPDHADDFLHSYKFKNSIERRFSRSQDSEAADMVVRAAHAHGKVYSHKRRRAQPKPAPSTSTSNSGSTEEARDTSPQDTSSDSPHHYEKPPPTHYVPVFALNALGKYYVPVSVDSACLSKHAGAWDALDARGAHVPAPLHPVTIHVNFQPCLGYHVKREPSDREWRAP